MLSALSSCKSCEPYHKQKFHNTLDNFSTDVDMGTQTHWQ